MGALRLRLSTRFWGTLKLAFGVAEVAVGTAAVYTGVGAPFGVIAIVHGLDTMYAGAAQVVSGTESDTLTKRLANSVFLASFKPANEQEKQQLEMFGEGIDSLVGIVGGLGGMGGAKAAFNGAKQLKQGGRVANAAGGFDDVGAAAGALSKSRKGQHMRQAASHCDNACFSAQTHVSHFLWRESNLVEIQYDGLHLNHSLDKEINWAFIGLGILAGAMILVARPRQAPSDDQAEEVGGLAA